MTYTLHKGAEDDLAEAARFYRREGSRALAARFLDEFEITVEIQSGVVTGRFPKRALSLVMEWYSLHKTELAEDWSLAQGKQQLKTIDPLE